MADEKDKKRVAVFVKGGQVVMSEDMTEGEALQEMERILGEEPGTGGTTKIIRLGKRAAFRSIDFERIEIQDPPAYFA